MNGNCGGCGSGILMHEKTGNCLECSDLLCETCHEQYCNACNKRFAANLAAELRAMDPTPKPTEPPYKYMSGVSRERAEWDELGYGK